jgi:hypothetical protein
MEGVVKEEWVESNTTLEDLLVMPPTHVLGVDKKFDTKPTNSRIEVSLPAGKVEHQYTYIPISSIPARKIEKIPFSHPRQILPLLRVTTPSSKR